MRLAIDHVNARIEFLGGDLDSQVVAEAYALCRIYNRNIGPVTGVTVHKPEPTDLGMYGSMSVHAPIARLLRDVMLKAPAVEDVVIPAGGKGPTMRRAFFGGLGEASERLLAGLHVSTIVEALIPATYDELVAQGVNARGPHELPLFAAEQYARPRFPYRQFRGDDLVTWIQGNELLTGEPVLVPAQLVLMYEHRLPDEAPIAYPTTGGLAFHVDRRIAILHAAYELIERDAVNVRWYCSLPPPVVDLDLEAFSRDRFGLNRVRMSTRAIGAPQIYLDTVDIPVPVFSAFAVDRSRTERALLSGAGAAAEPERALEQALFELGQCRVALRFIEPTPRKNIRADSDISELTEFFDAVVYFGYAENLHRLSWYTAGSERVAWDAIPAIKPRPVEEEYSWLIAMMRDCGLRPIVFDFSGACWPGTSIVKLLVPELTQAGTPAYPFLGHPRFAAPPTLGDSTATPRRGFSDLNRDPVPLP